jgi:hypothetical protein
MKPQPKREGGSVKLVKISGDADCKNGNCPTVYRTARGTLIVQGHAVDSEQTERLTIPAGESLVEIPLDVLLDAARALG